MAKQIVQDFYVYNAYQASLAAAASQDLTIRIEADSAFELQKLTFYCDAGAIMTASDRVIPQMSIQITDQGSGRQLFNQAVPVSTIFGTAELPFILPVTKFFKPNSLVTLSLANFSSATTYSNIYANLIGKKLFNI